VKIHAYKFTEKSAKNLAEMEQKLSVKSEQVIGQALGVLRWVIDEQEKGSQILVQYKDGTFGSLESYLPEGGRWQ
jgi:hypothetical protein